MRQTLKMKRRDERWLRVAADTACALANDEDMDPTFGNDSSSNPDLATRSRLCTHCSVGSAPVRQRVEVNSGVRPYPGPRLLVKARWVQLCTHRLQIRPVV